MIIAGVSSVQGQVEVSRFWRDGLPLGARTPLGDLALCRVLDRARHHGSRTSRGPGADGRLADGPIVEDISQCVALRAG